MGVDAVDPDEVDAEELLGSAIERREDPELLTGEAEFTDDIARPGMGHLAFLRSRYGHARIGGIDTSGAEELDGVVAVHTGEEVDLELPCGFQLEGLNDPPFPALATDRVRYQGDAVAAVVAEDRYAAAAAVDRIDVDYERLDAVVDPVEAVEDDDAPQLHEGAPDNVAFDWEHGDADATEEAFEAAARVVDLDVENQRLIPNAMEPRAAVAAYRPSAGKLSVEMTTQNPPSTGCCSRSSSTIPNRRSGSRPRRSGAGSGARSTTTSARRSRRGRRWNTSAR